MYRIGGALWERLRLEGLLWLLQSVCLLTDSSLPGLLSLSARGRSSSRAGGRGRWFFNRSVVTAWGGSCGMRSPRDTTS